MVAILKLKTAAKAHARNVAAKSRLKTLKKAFVAAADAEKGPEAYAAYCSALDKAAKHGIIPKNTAIRKKARAGAMVRKAASK